MIRAALDAISLWAIPVLLVGDPARRASFAKVKVYDVFIEGAKEGFDVAVKHHPVPGRHPRRHRHVPRLGRHGSADGRRCGRWSRQPAFPRELVPLAILRSLTGSGSLAFTTDLIKTLRPRLAHRRAWRRRCTDRRRRRSTCWPCTSARSASAGRGTPCPPRSSATRRGDRRGGGLRVDVLERFYRVLQGYSSSPQVLRFVKVLPGSTRFYRVRQGSTGSTHLFSRPGYLPFNRVRRPTGLRPVRGSTSSPERRSSRLLELIRRNAPANLRHRRRHEHERHTEHRPVERRRQHLSRHVQPLMAPCEAHRP